MELEFNFLAEPEISTILVPFLVTEYALENLEVGYNFIEEIVKNQPVASENIVEESDSLNLIVNAMIASFHKDPNAIKTLVSFMKCAKDSHIGKVKTPKKNMWVPSKESVKFPCRCNGFVSASNSYVIFEPDETEPWPHGLELNQELFTMSREVSHRVNIAVHNNKNYQILIKGGTVLGRLDSVKSIIPADAKLASTIVSNSTQNIAVFQQKDTNVLDTKAKGFLQTFSSSLT